jgi:hypothetical protein
MAFKDIVSHGEDTVIEQVDRAYLGKRKAVFFANGTTGLVGLEGKDLSVLQRMTGFTGVAAAGPATLTGALKGDVVLGIVDLAGGDASADFESTISVAGEIQQSSSTDLHTHHFIVLLLKRGLAGAV